MSNKYLTTEIKITSVILFLAITLLVLNRLPGLLGNEALFKQLFNTHYGKVISAIIITRDISLAILFIIIINIISPLASDAQTDNKQRKNGFTFSFPFKTKSRGFQRMALVFWFISTIGSYAYLISLFDSSNSDIEGISGLLIVLVAPPIMGFFVWFIVSIQAWIFEGFSEDIREKKLESSLVEKLLDK